MQMYRAMCIIPDPLLPQVLGIKPGDHEYLIWECLGKLRQIDVANAPASLIMKHLLIAENEILARLVRPFESFLASVQYKAWQEELLEQEKQREKMSRMNKSHASPQIPTRTVIMSHQASTTATAKNNAQINNYGTHTAAFPSPSPSAVTLDQVPSATDFQAPSVKDTRDVYPLSPNSANSSARIVTCSDAYPDILIVDDSLVTLKLTGLTLEKDGHHVERALNGQVALQLMKSRPYDVVLIDINMPVMDGFETVRLFREFENSNNNLVHIPSDVSSISDSDGDFEANYGAYGHASPSRASAGNMQQGHPANAGLTEYTKPFMKSALTAAHYHQLIIGISTNVDEETKKKALDCGE
ncbi:response regulator [archaeon]|nr:MAG: response regulator [archaeon]